MKNDIILFAVMFAVAWIGFTVAKDRLLPTTTVTEGINADAVAPTDQSAAAKLNLPPATSSAVSIANGPQSSDDSPTGSTAKETASTADSGLADAQTNEQKIEEVLIDQTKAWNRGDLDAFMSAYWNDEALTFSGGGDTTLGWQATYDSYRQRYPVNEMGEIKFKDLKTEMVGKESAIVTGRFDHELTDEKVKGNFSLVVKVIDGKWKIIHDHTSVAR